MIRENASRSVPGIPMLVLLLVLLLGGLVAFIGAARAHDAIQAWTFGGLWLVAFVCSFGFVIVNPNEAQVVTLFGRYTGSARNPGLWWVNPFTVRKRVSLRVRNFESAKLKVNDHDGNPIEIAAVVVWRVVDSAEALFQVDNYQQFVSVQSESALRNLATTHAYDSHVDEAMSLRGNTAEIAEALKAEIQARLQQAGVEVIEARISHLAYAPEIAGAMLRRQQASAIVAARQKFVEGAVGMVEMALEQLAAKHVVVLDDERKAAMVSNMLVVLCSDQHTQPVVNAGTLYQ
jgi:regulator of protease activity HflC (stomatin/prohibitin superfamily)